MESSRSIRDRIRGGMAGCAAGDALGYPIEFWSRGRIIQRFGPNGLTGYLQPPGGRGAPFSDDTQLLLFTACGLMAARAHRSGDLLGWAYRAHMDWLSAQSGRESPERICWLLDEPVLQESRAPGNTALYVLRSGVMGSIDRPVNGSSASGALARTAAAGMLWGLSGIASARLGAEIAALTHGGALGYLPGAFLACMVNCIVFRGMGLRRSMTEAMDTVASLYARNPGLPALRRLVEQAVQLSESDGSDEANLAELGEGWTADEALAIALYCCLRNERCLDGALTVAANHSGDSDTVAAVSGCIMGAEFGYERVPEKWRKGLEGLPLILEVADDLAMTRYAVDDVSWQSKYFMGKKTS